MDKRKNRWSLVASLKASQKENDIELVKWAKAMLATKRDLDEVPAGWFNIKQLANKLGFVPSGIGPHLKKLVNDGKAESKKFKTTRCKDGRAMSVTYFKLIE